MDQLDSLSLNDNDSTPTLSGSSSASLNTLKSRPKTSLLSSSLANAKQQENATDERIPLSIADESVPEHLQHQLDVLDDATLEHPSPSLLATSVGRDVNGRLIPSSSNISLLSLNIQGIDDFELGPKSSVNKPTISTTDSVLHQSGSNTNLSQRNSVTNLNSWNSRANHLNQQRLQHYHASLAKFTPRLTPLPANEVLSVTSPKPILNRTKSEEPPDSPNLNPTSLGGSPTHFLLTSQTPPPSSLSGSLTQSYFSLEPLSYITPLSNTSQSPGLHSPGLSFKRQNSFLNSQRSQPISIPSRSTIQNNGGDSPILNPVQTPHEAPPMTPLLLSGLDTFQQEIHVDDIE